MKNQKGFVWLPILLSILGVLVVGSGAYYVIHQKVVLVHNPKETTQTTQPQNSVVTQPHGSNALTASPTSGIAGRTVITFSSSYGGQTGASAGYFIDFGDNSEALFACGESIPALGAVNEACLPATVQHTYTGAGARPTNVGTTLPQPVTYTATLHRLNVASFNDSPVVGTATVTVTGWNTLPAPTCVLTASPSTVAVGQKVTISWTTQNANDEGPTGNGVWVGRSSSSIGLLEQMVAPTKLGNAQIVTAKKIGSETLGLEINGPGGNGEGSCSVTVTATMLGQPNVGISQLTPIGGSYYKDSQHVYSQVGYEVPQIIPGADPATFAYLGNPRGYDMGKDTQHVYVFTQVSSADSSTLHIFDDGEWMKDSHHVYLGAGLSPLMGADPNTFVIVEEGNLVKDATHVWTWKGNLLSGADPATFTVLAGGYEKDASHVWYDYQLIPNADVSTFIVTGDGTAKDANHVYGHSAPDHLGNTGLTIDGVVQ